MDVVYWETVLSGPRWLLPAGTISRGIGDAGLRDHVELHFERRSVIREEARVHFKVSGPFWAMAAYRESLIRALRRSSGLEDAA